jgi:Tol biopolymer transport system component/ribosomal protein L24E
MFSLRRRPRLLGVLAAVAMAVTPALPGGSGAQAASAPTKGYWFVAGDGGIFSFGDGSFFGSTGNLKLNQPIVGMAPSPTGRGYWFVAADGGIFAFGDAAFHGSTGAIKLNRPIVGMAPTPTGKGYWFVASDGGIFAFGDAKFFGSTGAIKLAKPIVGMAATPTGRGYWFVASDGGIFNYGDAKFFGSAVGKAVRSPIVSMAATPTGQGYLLAGADGSVHAFGDAVARGSMAGKALTSPIVGLAPTATGAGYWLVAADGGIFSFGDAAFYGSTGNLRLNRSIVGMAAAPLKTAGGNTSPTSPGGTNPGGTTPGGGTTDTTLPGGGTTDTTLPPVNSNVNWGPAGSTTIVARAATGGGSGAYRPWMNADGRYLVFDSDSKQVIKGTVDPVSIRDVYLYDRTTESIERISWGLNGARAHLPEANQTTGACTGNPCGSQRPTISADGRYVAFWSSADNLVAGDTNGKADAFLYDRQDRKMILVSKGFQGAAANGDSRRPVVSRDGNAVVFESAASNLIAPPECGLPIVGGCRGGDGNNADDVFRYDIATEAVTLVSADAGGASGNGSSNRPSVSRNGQRIAFQSTAPNLVANDANGQMSDVFLRDGQTTSVVSTGASGQGNKSSRSPSVSADGRFISFDSDATNFDPADGGADTDVYIKNLETGALEQVSKRADGGQASGGTTTGGDSTISADGRFVAFWSDATNLVPNDTKGVRDVFVRDRVANTVTRVTSTNGAEGDADTFSPALSMDGRFVAMDSDATTLATGGSASAQDLFVHVNY